LKYNGNDLAEMLTYKRSKDSSGEKAFIRRYIDNIPGIKKDGFGNRYKKIGKSDTCFACHTDTVHGGYRYRDEPDGSRQEVYIKKGWAFTDRDSILGADDGTGCFICLNMIYARVPGLYIFHREEESGGGGSRYIAATNKLMGYKKVISLDRKGYCDVITHQGMSETCSQEFAKALARQLGGCFKPCSGGVFTDSANYVWIVPECTNLSIGYFNGHTTDEVQDLRFAERLAQKMIRVKWSSLPVVREIKPKPEPVKKGKSHPYGSYGYKPADYWGYSDPWGRDDDDKYRGYHW
jgi:hypothetical protein